MWLADVAPIRRMPTAIDHLTYTVPDALVEQLRRGSMVAIPLRAQKIFGVILRVYPGNEDALRGLKPIAGLVGVIVPEAIMATLERAAVYFAVSVTSLVHAFLPVPGKRWKHPTQHSALQHSSVSSVRPTQRVLIEPASPDLLIQELIALCKRYQANGKTTHVIAPTPFIAKQLQAALEHHFETRLITGEIPAGKRWTIFVECLGMVNDVRIEVLITTRSGIAYPLRHRGAIVLIDDAHTEHKQWDTKPRYDARTFAHFLADAECVDLFSLSLAPRLESYLQYRSQTQLDTVPTLMVHINTDTRTPISTPTQDLIDDAEDAGKRVLILPETPYPGTEQGQAHLASLALADLVVLLFPDVHLYANEWSAEERLFGRLLWLLRAMRSNATLLFVARTPHRVFGGLMPSRRKAYIQRLLDERREMRYPPFGSFVKCIVQSDVSVSDAVAQAERIVEQLSVPPGIEVLGPYPSEPAYVRGRYRALFLLHGSSEHIALCKPALTKLHDQVLVDIDPERIFR